MGRPISLFTDFKQSENRVTNYTGLIFKLIYQESPAVFEELISSIVPSGLELQVGPTFTQQERKEKSIPDLCIRQSSFQIFFETKLTDWFYSDQLERHINSMSEDSGTKLLICLSNFERDDPESEHQEMIKRLAEKKLTVAFISFESLLADLDSLDVSPDLKNHIAEYSEYLDSQGLLPAWKYLLDVVNCGHTLQEVESGAYVCPNTGGAYSHRRAKFFGPYANKSVNRIYEIDAVVDCGPGFSDPAVLWVNGNDSKKKIIERAKSMEGALVGNHPNELKKSGLRFFLLSNGHKTNFQKDTPGGLQGSKKYFWNIARNLNPLNAEELANYLNNRKWSEFR
jgi:hypothetical protein